MNIVIFCLGDKWQDWENMGFANRSANIAKELSGHPSVSNLIIVNNPTSYVQAFRKYLRGLLTERRMVWRSVYGFFIDEVAPKTTVIEQIRLLPRERTHHVSFLFNGAFYDGGLIRQIKRLVEGKQKVPLVVWLNSPVFAKFIGLLDEDLVVYDARDDWFFHPQLRPIRKAIANGYRSIGEKADLVFAVSEKLITKFMGDRPDAVLIPNGIDDNIFAPSSFEAPGDIASLPRPIIGYIGKMQQRFDVDFLAEAAGLMPNTSFVLLGPVFAPDHFKRLKSLPNVYFLGRKHQSLMPCYINHFDVCMMPHINDALTSAMNPLKLYEYLAFGKPTICTRVEGLDHFKGLVEIVDDPGEFVDRVRLLLREPEEEKHKRIEFAAEQSWRKRVDLMVEILERKLELRGCREHRKRRKYD